MIEIKRSQSNANSDEWEYWFHIKAKNGQILATSEMYTSKWQCKKGIMALLRICGRQSVLISEPFKDKSYTVEP